MSGRYHARCECGAYADGSKLMALQWSEQHSKKGHHVVTVWPFGNRQDARVIGLEVDDERPDEKVHP